MRFVGTHHFDNMTPQIPGSRLELSQSIIANHVATSPFDKALVHQ